MQSLCLPRKGKVCTGTTGTMFPADPESCALSRTPNSTNNLDQQAGHTKDKALDDGCTACNLYNLGPKSAFFFAQNRPRS